MRQQLTAGDVCKRKITVGYRHTSLLAAAQLMREDHVGSLVVVDDANGHRRVRGLITDRDIVTAVVATGLDDVLKILAHEMNMLVGAIGVGLQHERAQRP